MIRKSLKLIFITTILFLMMPASTASAHRPDKGKDEGITQISDPEVSFAFYRTFDAPGQVHFYEFNGTKGRPFHAGINIPQLARLKDYAVNLALIGPGLSMLDTRSDSQPFGFAWPSSQSDQYAGEQFSPFRLADEIDLSHMGAVVEPNQANGEFFEPFTITRYWTRQEINLTLPESGTYYLVVWNASGQPGKYVMDTGRLEVFSPADLFNFPVWFVQTHIYFENYILLAGVPLAALLIITAWYTRRRRAFQAAEPDRNERFPRPAADLSQ